MFGQVFHLRNWTHHQANLQVGMGIKEKGLVAVMVHVGNEPKDGSAPLDLEAAMRRLGWVRGDKK